MEILEEENTVRMFQVNGMGKNFLEKTTKVQETKVKVEIENNIKQKLLQSKEHNQQGEEITYRIGENICKLFLKKRLELRIYK